MHEFKYSYPLAQKNDDEDESQSELLAYFHTGTMDLDRLIVRANSLNITSPFTLYANQPVTPAVFTAKDMEFPNVECKKATNTEQEKLDNYVMRFLDLLWKTQ